jgi:hypothetical protein
MQTRVDGHQITVGQGRPVVRGLTIPLEIGSETSDFTVDFVWEGDPNGRLVGLVEE